MEQLHERETKHTKMLHFKKFPEDWKKKITNVNVEMTNVINVIKTVNREE